ncbi:hypothetical protein BGZ79_008421 [Entomortierella chlamydospora]|nr:hypothetical protein BGZ79_008421 [Entomortierella chlamydospora]
MNYGLVSQDLHVAVIPEVTVEFETVDDGSEVADVEQHVQSSISSVNHLTSSDQADKQVNEDDPSPMDKEEFAYPSHLTSDPIVLDDEGQSYSEQGSYASPSISPSGSKRFELSKDLTEGEDFIGKMGHSRSLNTSSGSDLVQVSVEDLLRSEEMVRTIKSTKSNRKHGQQDQEQGEQSQLPLKTTPSSSSSSLSSKTMTTITATIRATGERARSIVFDDDLVLGPNRQSQDREKQDPAENQTHKNAAQAQRVSRPPAPKILTPAQQREAEADDNIQKAIELHENNQLEEATHYFKLAAQSENPLGQLMYGLSLRHGWGCKPNPTEAIVYLQRAAEYAMGEMNELQPIAIAAPPLHAFTSNTQLASISPPLSPQTSVDEKPSAANDDTTNVSSNKQPVSHQTLRRMGSMDRKEAMAMARNELVMALYELGMSYLKGWGVTKDKAVGFTYFKIAADLGDADSQNETALCYYEGIGVEKDMYESARYYRMAASQGATQLGNSWIWKPKYDQYCAAERAGVAVAAGIKKAHDKPRRLATAIQTAFHGSSNANKSGGALSPPISPSASSNRYSMSSIASGLASVTTATAGAVASSSHSNTIRQSLASPPSTPPVSTSASAPVSSRPRSMSTTSAGIGATSSTSSASKSIFAASTSSPTSPTGELEKKKNRWTMWGGLRSMTSPAVTTSQ